MQSDLELSSNALPFTTKEGGQASEETFSIGPVPDWVLPREVLWNSPGRVDEHALFLLIDSQYSHENRCGFERVVRKIITPEAVQKLSHIDIDYDPKISRLCIHQVAVWRNGVCQSFADRRRFILRQREGGLGSQILDGRVSAILVLDDVRPGDAIEWSYSLITTHELEGKKLEYAFLLERPLRTIAWYVTLHLPKGPLPPYRQSNGGFQSRELLEREGQSIWIWTGSQNGDYFEEDHVPIWEPAFLWAQLSCYEDWAEVSRMLEGNWRAISSGDEETRDWARSFASAGGGLDEQVLQVVRWIQDQIRYQGMEMGLGGVLPSSPDTVLGRRFGDCKDKTLLLCSALWTLGLEAEPVLVNTSLRGEVKNQLPCLSAFNHAIVTFVLEGKRGFVDPTARGAGGDIFHQCLPHYEMGLVVAGGHGGLIPIPHVSGSLSAWLIQEEFFLAPKGSRSTLIQRVEATGFEADLMRSVISRQGRQSYAREEAKDLQRFFSDLQPLGYVGVTDHRDKNHILIETRFQFSDWGKEPVSDLRTFGYNARWLGRFVSAPPPQPPRKRNFMLRFPLCLRHEVIVHSSLVPGQKEDVFTDCRWFRSRTEMEYEGRHTARTSYTIQVADRMVEVPAMSVYLLQFNMMAEATGCMVRIERLGRTEENSCPQRPLAEGSEGEADFAPRLTGAAGNDFERWFAGASRRISVMESPASDKGWNIRIGIFFAWLLFMLLGGFSRCNKETPRFDVDPRLFPSSLPNGMELRLDSTTGAGVVRPSAFDSSNRGDESGTSKVPAKPEPDLSFDLKNDPSF